MDNPPGLASAERFESRELRSGRNACLAALESRLQFRRALADREAYFGGCRPLFQQAVCTSAAGRSGGEVDFLDCAVAGGGSTSGIATATRNSDYWLVLSQIGPAWARAARPPPSI